MYYLQMDGEDDYFRSASFTFNEIIMDVHAEQASGVEQYYSFSNGIGSSQFHMATTNTDRYGSFWKEFYTNDVLKAWNTVIVPKNERATIRCVANTNGTGTTAILSHDNGYGRTKGRIYSVTFKNNGVVVAHYDMSTQTVQDQSGNGNHATLTGGTFVDDGSGGEPVGTTHSITGSSAGTVQTIADVTRTTYATGTSAGSSTSQAFPSGVSIFGESRGASSAAATPKHIHTVVTMSKGVSWSFAQLVGNIGDSYYRRKRRNRIFRLL